MITNNRVRYLIYSQVISLSLKAKRGQLWVPLIEKAAAKIHGCYEALSSGLTVESLALLTGEPCEHVSLRGKFISCKKNRDFYIILLS